MSERQSNSKRNVLTKRQLNWLLGIVAAIALIAFCVNGPFAKFFASSTAADDSQFVGKSLPVNVLEIEFVDSITQSRAYTGTVRARRRSDLGFELPGRIAEIFVDEGDSVIEGQTLAQLDTETLDAQKEATLARLAQANSVMDELNAGPREETIKAARANKTAAESEYDNAVLNLQRRRRLRDAGAISTEEFDQASFAEKTAKANLNAAEEQLSELEAGTRQEQLAAQESGVRQLESAVKEIDVAISKSKLIAPFAGRVTRRYLDAGSIAQSSMPVVKLVEQQHLEAWIGLPVEIVSDLEIGTTHEILVGGKPYSVVATAKISELDPVTRTQTVLFTLDSAAAKKVVSGQLCEIQISSSVDSSGCWIPTSALTKGVRGLWSVMVIVPAESGSNFRAEKRDIEIIKTDSIRVLAKGTIENGDRIIVNGVHRISEGQLVNPVND